MSETNLSYTWAYFTKSETYAKCKICDKTFQLGKNYWNVMRHIQSMHRSDSTVTSKDSNSRKKIRKIKKDKKQSFSITEDNQVKCDFCKKSYNINYTVTYNMKHHLKTIHKIDKNTAQKQRILYQKHIKRNLYNTMTCNYCNQVFQNNDYFFMIHLITVHEIDVSLEIGSELNDGSSCLPNIEVNDIVTSSTYQQPHTTYSFEYNLNNSSKSNRNAENIATLSSYQQPTFSSDDSFNCDDYDNIDNFDSLVECLKELKK